MSRWMGAFIAATLIAAEPSLAQPSSFDPPAPGAGSERGAGAFYDFMLTSEQLAEATSVVQDWLIDARIGGAGAPNALSLLVGEVDILLELRGQEAWRGVRERLETDPYADITYAPEFRDAYVLTGSFEGTDSGFYDLVLRDGGDVASVSMRFPVGADRKASYESQEIIETIACSVHFGAAALPCAR